MPSSDVHLSYFKWRGTSAGAGFTRTWTTSIEVDLVPGSVRRVEHGARGPQPMLPPEAGATGGGRLTTDWTQLSSAKVKELTGLVEAWLATEPPSVYHRVGGLGREDGYVERLVVRRGGRTYATSINPRREALPGDPHRPPPEWYQLIAALRHS